MDIILTNQRGVDRHIYELPFNVIGKIDLVNACSNFQNYINPFQNYVKCFNSIQHTFEQRLYGNIQFNASMVSDL